MNVITSISRYKSCNLWLDGLRSESTKAVYAVHLSLFCKFYHTNPDDLVKRRSEELKQMVINYTLELRNKSKKIAGKPKMGEMSVNSIKQYLAGVKSFLNEHEINLPWNKIAKLYPDEVTNEFRSYTRQELSKLISLADLRDRCVILLMASGGIRVGAIPSLTIKSLERLDEGLGVLTVYGESKKSRYVTLVTPECMLTIDEYLEQRRKLGEKINERSCLIRDKYSIYSKRINAPKCPRERAINKQIRHLIRKAGLAFEELQPDHAARKFFDTALVNSKVDGEFKELMMGHSVGLDEAYYDENNEESCKQIKLEYMKAVNSLTITDEHRLRSQITDYEDKQKNMPRLEQLQELLTSRSIEQDSIKKTVEKLQREKELQDQHIRENETEMKSMRELLTRFSTSSRK
ncbi:MAG: tyrosine-type recombinase/integrase [Nitrososphaeraceae archaeon]|nr:tyrosine-type recombinase/integrase [Nitrososphaeraceae archaeon]